MDTATLAPATTLPPPLRAFHNDPAIKGKYIARVEGHMQADNLIKGTGWDHGKGCAVGCTLEAYDHARYPIELGIPEWLAHVEDRLFEGMTLERSTTWPRDFLAAITPGADLEQAKAPFVLACLRSTLASLDSVTVAAEHQDIVTLLKDARAAVQHAIDLWSRSDLYSSEWQSARADLAARAARADLAARAALAALYYWCGDEATYDLFAEQLLDILRDLPASEIT